MRRYHLVDTALKSYYRAIYEAMGNGSFGQWCRYNENVFCQEREGCQNCTLRR